MPQGLGLGLSVLLPQSVWVGEAVGEALLHRVALAQGEALGVLLALPPLGVGVALPLPLPVTLSVPDSVPLAEGQLLVLHVRLTLALGVSGMAYA